MLTTRRVFVVVASIAVLVAGIARAQTPDLQYGFEAENLYGYDIQIKIETEAYTETLTGHNLFRVTAVEDDQIRLLHVGILKPKRERKPGVGIVGYAPELIQPAPVSFSIDRRGNLVRPARLKSLPYVLGFLETFVLEKLPAQPRSTWSWEDEFQMVQSPFLTSGFFFRKSHRSRKAEERIDYTIAEVKGDLVHVDKKYLMRTGEGVDDVSRAKMEGLGWFVFNKRTGMVTSIAMNYTLLLKDDDGSRTVKANAECRQMSSDRVEQLFADLEEKRKEMTGEVYAEVPKKPLTSAERTKLLRDLRSRGPEAAEAAIARLLSAPVDDRPADFAVPLAKILLEGGFPLRAKAARALVTWATPKVEEALAEATEDYSTVSGVTIDGGYPIADAAYHALATIGTESAARIIAGKIDEPTKAPIEALKRMGSVAEVVMLELLNEKGIYERRAACEVLGEVGGLQSVPALKQAADHWTTRTQGGAALESIAKRQGLSVEELLAKAPAAAPTTEPKPSETASSGFRTWSDNTGKFEIEAQMVAAGDGVVTLRKRDGKTVDVPVKRLSQADQDVIAGRSQSRSQAMPRRSTAASRRDRIRGGRGPSSRESEDTVIVGGPGGGPFRRVDPRGRPVVGVHCRLGSWAGKPSLNSIDPIYDRGRHPFPITVIARDGYALGAIQVDADDLVRAVRMAFMKIDGDKLDTSDSYVSDWIGTPTGGEPVVLSGKGKPILGFCGRRAAALNAVGIVVEAP